MRRVIKGQEDDPLETIDEKINNLAYVDDKNISSIYIDGYQQAVYGESMARKNNRTA